MLKLGYLCTLLCFLVLNVLFLLPTDASAYLDPGTGSFMLQMAAAGIIAGIFAAKAFWGRLRAFYQRTFSRPPANPDSHEGE